MEGLSWKRFQQRFMTAPALEGRPRKPRMGGAILADLVQTMTDRVQRAAAEARQ